MNKKRPSEALAKQVMRSGTSAGKHAVSSFSRLSRETAAVIKKISSFFTRTFSFLNAKYEKYQDTQSPRLSMKEQMFFAKRLSFLINAGVPILESLHMISEQVPSRNYTRVMKSLISDVSNGQSLARSLGRFPDTFGDFGINIVKIGESSGTLSKNLEYLAEELRKRHTLKQKVTGAFVYPAVITLATLSITGFLMLYLFPKIMPVFASLHMELPLTTKIVIAISTFLQHWGLLVLILLIVFLVFASVILKRSEKVRFVYDSWMLRAPIFGEMISFYNIANATRTLGLLLRSGVTLSEALPLTSDTTRNLVYKKEYQLLAETITRGERVSTHLFTQPKLFPAVMTQMVAVGERSGSLSDSLVYLSELYEAEVDDFTKNLSSLIEPALMVIMGVMVGFIAISIITPIYGITQNLHP